MTVWGWVIIVMGILSWVSLIEEDGLFSATLGTLFFVFAGLALVYLGKKSSINATKYKKYIDLIVNKRVRSIATISSAIPVPHDIAMKDIQEMIKKGFFEDAYINFNRDEIVLFNADDVANQIKNHKVEMLLAPCNGCGANNKVEKGQVENCQYCGSLVGDDFKFQAPLINNARATWIGGNEMIPKEVKNWIGKYFSHNYLPDEEMIVVVDKLLPPCICTEKENFNFDELVRWAIEIIKGELENKKFK